MPSTPITWSLTIHADEPPTDKDLRAIGELIGDGYTSGTIQRYAPGRITEIVPLGPTNIGELTVPGQFGAAWQRRFARPRDPADGRLADCHRVAVVTIYLIRDIDEPTSLRFEQHVLYGITEDPTEPDVRRHALLTDETLTSLRSATESEADSRDNIARHLCATIDLHTLDWTRPSFSPPQEEGRTW